MKITIVDFSAGGDGITALYIDGKLHKYGDYYHDKINDNIEGFLEGLKFAKVKFKVKTVNLTDDNPWVEDTSANGNPPPDKFEDIFESAP